MQSQSLIRWQEQICHPNIDAITAEMNVPGLIPMCNVCKNMTWGERKSSFALHQQTRSPVAPTERQHNQIPVLQVWMCHSQRSERDRHKLMSNALIQRRGMKDIINKIPGGNDAEAKSCTIYEASQVK